MVWRGEGRGNILVFLPFRDLIEKKGGAAAEVGANSGEHYVTEAWGITYFQREEKLQHHFCALCTKDG